MTSEHDGVDLVKELAAQSGVESALEEPSDLLEVVELVDSETYWDISERLVRLCDEEQGRAGWIIEQLGVVLDEGDDEMREMAVLTVAELAESHPDQLRETIPLLVSRLDDRESVADNAALALSQLAPRYPEALVPAVSRCAQLFESEWSFLRERALNIVVSVAHVDPGAVVPVVPYLVSFVGSERDANATRGVERVENEITREEITTQSQIAEGQFETQRAQAALALRLVAERRPDALEDAVPELNALVERTTNPRTLGAVVAILWPIARASPAAVKSSIAPLVDSIRVADLKRRAVVLGALGSLVEHYPEEVAGALAPLVLEVAELLEADDPNIRGAAAGVLAYVAEYRPDAISPAKPALRSLLDDEHVYVRGSATWALGFSGDESATSKLRELAASDPDAAVRRAAAKAIEPSNDK